MQPPVHDSEQCLHQQGARLDGRFGEALCCGGTYSVAPADVDMITVSKPCPVQYIKAYSAKKCPNLNFTLLSEMDHGLNCTCQLLLLQSVCNEE